jgi:hypothetical protein
MYIHFTNVTAAAKSNTDLSGSSDSAAYNWKTWRTFLASPSTDTNYKKLMLLLYATKVSEQMLPPASADYYPGR